MLHRDYPTQYCSVASTLEIIGERWTILILRDVFLGIRRFEDLQRTWGWPAISSRPGWSGWSSTGCWSSGPTRSGRVRHEYRLTEKGADLWPVLVSLLKWGDRYAIEGERPIILAAPRLRWRARRSPPLH